MEATVPGLAPDSSLLHRSHFQCITTTHRHAAAVLLYMYHRCIIPNHIHSLSVGCILSRSLAPFAPGLKLEQINSVLSFILASR
jgi:hypothetical protein